MAASKEFAPNVPSSSKVQVTVRVKPATFYGKLIVSKIPENSGMMKMNDEYFSFDNIKWGNESQDQVYKVTAFPFVEKLLQGYSAIIFANGERGSGKSYTMGTLIQVSKTCENCGLIQRCLRQIFEQKKIHVSASFMEVCDKKLCDLFRKGARFAMHKGAPVNLKIKNIESLEEGLQLVRNSLGWRTEYPVSRKTSSSRSHAVLTLYLKIEFGKKVLKSQLSLVDLAASDNFQQSIEGEGKLTVWNSNIHKSLSVLNHVFTAMAKNKDSQSIQMLCMDSPLTSVLKDSLDYKCLISLVSCISSDLKDYHANLRTLRFAQAARLVKIEPQIDTFSNKSIGWEEASAKKLCVVLSPLPINQINKKEQNTTTDLSIEHKVTGSNVVLSTHYENFPIIKRAQKLKENKSPLNRSSVHTRKSPMTSVQLNALDVLERGSSSLLSIEDEVIEFDMVKEKLNVHDLTQTRDSDKLGDKQANLTSQAALSLDPHEIFKTPGKKFSNIMKSTKRLGAILETDFSELSHTNASNEIRKASSQIFYHTPNKVIKFSNKFPELIFNQLPNSTAILETCSQENRQDHIQKQKKGLRDRQIKHNNNILRILNTSNATELMGLPRIGFKTAVMIYQYRMINGDFESFKDLENMPTWTEKVYRNFLTANNVVLQ